MSFRTRGTRLLLFLRHISLRTFIFSLFTYFLAFFSYTNLIFSMSYLSLWLCPHYSPYMPTLYDAWYFSTYLTHFSFFFSQIKTKSFQISFSIISGLFFASFLLPWLLLYQESPIRPPIPYIEKRYYFIQIFFVPFHTNDHNFLFPLLVPIG